MELIQNKYPPFQSVFDCTDTSILIIIKETEIAKNILSGVVVTMIIIFINSLLNQIKVGG